VSSNDQYYLTGPSLPEQRILSKGPSSRFVDDTLTGPFATIPPFFVPHLFKTLFFNYLENMSSRSIDFPHIFIFIFKGKKLGGKHKKGTNIKRATINTDYRGIHVTGPL
jgi:hypothetical protein